MGSVCITDADFIRTSSVLTSTQKQSRDGRMRPYSPPILIKNTVLTQAQNATIIAAQTKILKMCRFLHENQTMLDSSVLSSSTPEPKISTLSSTAVKIATQKDSTNEFTSLCMMELDV